MAWATISTRKMELKNRINELSSQLIEISQQSQTLADKTARDEQATQLEGNYTSTMLAQDYQEAMSVVNKDSKASAASKQEALMEAQKDYNNKMSVFQSVQNAKASTNRQLTDAQAKALDAEKERLETQLSAARAEYQSLGQALDQDIKDSAIKLA